MSFYKAIRLIILLPLLPTVIFAAILFSSNEKEFKEYIKNFYGSNSLFI